MADAYIHLPDDSANAGKKVRSQTRVVGADTVHEHYNILTDITNDTQARVLTAAPTTEAGLVVRNIPSGVQTMDNDDTASSNNSTTALLGIDAIFTGTGDDCLGYTSITITLDSSHDSATDGMAFEFSTDNSNWDDVYSFTYTAADGARRFQFPVTARYFRVKYTNGGTGQTHFRVQTLLHRQTVLTTIHRIVDDTDPDRSATLTKSAIIAQAAGSGDFIPVQATATGNFKVSLEEVDGAIAGGGVEASALRVTMANDSTGLLSVDDNGSSLTIDTTGTSGIEVVQNIAADFNCTEVNSATIAGDTTSIDSKITACNTGDVTVGSSVLPTGAATESTLSTLDGKVIACNTGAVVIASGAVSASQSGVWNITNISGTVSLPTGAATESTLSTLDGKVVACNTGAVVISSGTLTGITNDVNIADGGNSITVDAPTATPVNVQIGDGSLQATVRDTGASDSLNVAIVDASGNQITSFGGGTQYTEDASAPGDPVGPTLQMVRQDTPAGITDTDGDWVARRSTNYGAAFCQILDSSGNFINTFGGSGGTSSNFGSAFPAAGTAVGFIDGSNNMAGALVDGAGHLQVDVLTGGGGGTQYTFGTDTYTETTSIGTAAGAYRNDTLATLVDTDNEFAPLQVNNLGALYVAVNSSALPTGAATESTLSTLNGKVTACDTGAVVVSSSALPAGAATEATLSTLNGKVTACNTGAVVIASGSVNSTLQTGSATVGKMYITDGTEDAAVNASNQLEVAVNSVAGLEVVQNIAADFNCTEVNSGTIAGDTTSIDGKITACDTGNVTVSSSVLPTGAATQTTLSSIDGKITACDTGAVVIASGTTVVTQSTAANLNAQIVGSIAHDTADAGNPVKIGGKARTTNPTAVADADRVDATFDDIGRQAVVLNQVRDLTVHATTTIASSTSETTILGAGGAGVFHDLTHITLTNATAATAVTVTIKDVTSGTTRMIIDLAAGGGAVQSFPVPVTQSAAANNWTATLSNATTTVHIFVQGVKNV